MLQNLLQRRFNDPLAHDGAPVRSEPSFGRRGIGMMIDDPAPMGDDGQIEIHPGA